MAPTRRFLLRGLFQGSVAVVALPLLDCFLDSKGEALAATGRAIPIRFGTFFWGCGLTKALYLPKSSGPNYETPRNWRRSSLTRTSSICSAVFGPLSMTNPIFSIGPAMRRLPPASLRPTTRSLMPRRSTKRLRTPSLKERDSARSKYPVAATSARVIPALAAATSIRRKPLLLAFTRACSAPDSKTRPKAIGSPIPK